MATTLPLLLHLSTMKPPITRDAILKAIQATKIACNEESIKRLDVQRTKDYQAVQVDIDGIEATMRDLAQELQATRARQDEMLKAVPDSRPKLEEEKRMLMQIMEAEGVEGYVEDWISVSGKWSEKKKVDGNRLLSVLGGDMDEFMQIAKPSQKSVKDYALERPDMKSALLSCITLESRELVDVEIQLPDAE